MENTFIKKLGVCAIASLILATPTYAENKISVTECEYSEEYLAWTRLSKKEKEKTPEPYKCKAVNIKMPTLGGPADAASTKYSLKDQGKVLPVRDQEDSGSCWAFATAASIESNLLINNINTDYISPGHMELLTQKDLSIPGLKTFYRSIGAGASYYTSSAYLTNYLGPVDENRLPYQTYLDAYHDQANYTNHINVDSIKMKPNYNVNQVVIFDAAQGKCSDYSIQTIKNQIANYGAVAAMMYYELTTDGTVAVPVQEGSTTVDLVHKFQNGPYYYYNGASYTDPNTNTVVPANQLSNHGVTIVGWDDTISATSFSTQNQPSRDGAWIVKNSYGTMLDATLADGTAVKVRMGDEGYYYISYDDINICSGTAAFYDVDTNVTDNIYYYDDLGLTGYVDAEQPTAYIRNVFHKKTDNTKREKLEKVTFATSGSNITYTVYIAQNDDPTRLRQIATGDSHNLGYVSIFPMEDIYVEDTFSIVIKMETKDNSNVLIPLASKIANSVYQNVTLTEDVSFISQDNNVWADVTTSQLLSQISIKAYTNTSDAPQEQPSQSQSQSESQSDGTQPSESQSGNGYNNNGEIDYNNPNNLGDNMNNPDNPKTGVTRVGILLVIATICGVAVIVLKENTVFKKLKN